MMRVKSLGTAFRDAFTVNSGRWMVTCLKVNSCVVIPT